ncbi:major facilitator superfamily domain-containing protein [Exophiala viscosa]|uniref:Major facilitator superfamily domain-containing protein n=1 Tax=Exophiala viscosa TaxID=2486360 RepID=A0AAN6DVA7_9EURO|nr:major facilitator superfamily domain-containing protein [Exophiala viscosa]KAI1625819.1 major facilitator superfamily domain-containing protein [Exophiala viscosa]
MTDKQEVERTPTLEQPGPWVMEDVTMVTLTEEDDRHIRRKTDIHLLIMLTWIYFLQVFDKAVFGTAALFNLRQDTGLTGAQYSLVASISSIAQLSWQPFSAWLIVKVPHRILMPSLVLGWGIAEACIAAARNFPELLVARFFLGLFEAGCIPLFTIITGQWYRRAEQPLRVSAWYSMNGLATMAASAVSYGLGHIDSELLRPWQIIFLFAGLLTILSAPLVYWKLDNGVTSARFLSEQERLQAVKRLSTNQTGIGSSKFRWAQAAEVAIEPKSWLWVIMAVLPNLGSALTSFFGPIIIAGLGFDKYEASLLNIPFGAMQTLVIAGACWVSYNMKMKGVALLGFMLPVVVGIAMLYGLDRSTSSRPALLAAYYLLAFLFAGNPLLLSWVVGNTAGTTKKSVTLSLYQAGLSAGGIAGPFMFKADQAPVYRSGVLGVLAIFIALIACIVLQLGILTWLNKQQRKKRIQNSKSADVVDQSMQKKLHAFDGIEEQRLEASAFADITDRHNDEFVYIY